MDPEFFIKLKTSEARLFLKNYLEESSKGFNSITPDLIEENIPFDYTLESLPLVLEWFSKRMVKIPEKPDYNLPSWITETIDYNEGLYHFDEFSNILILRASYYWGESFVRNTNLKWDIGKSKEYKNQPVLKKFIRNIEMAPFQICTNLIRNLVISDPYEKIKTCIDTWYGFLI